MICYGALLVQQRGEAHCREVAALHPRHAQAAPPVRPEDDAAVCYFQGDYAAHRGAVAAYASMATSGRTATVLGTPGSSRHTRSSARRSDPFSYGTQGILLRQRRLHRHGSRLSW